MEVLSTSITGWPTGPVYLLWKGEGNPMSEESGRQEPSARCLPASFILHPSSFIQNKI
jgi:hypothetical protein